MDKPKFNREHRLGLVVYGGIALAIYMNGVCQEFYNAVRGRGIYKLIKALTDSDIVVDIISGTSAGGINGVLLSYALANSDFENGKEIKFEEFAKVWIDSGDIEKLLFQKKDDDQEKESFFDGENYYKKELKNALSKAKKENMPKDDWFSEFGELDLYVTGTDILGRIYQTFDNTGSVIEVKDHQTVFHLKHRQDKNDFKTDDINLEALAKLCQITSCFPVAFPPVTVQLKSENDVDAKLVKWGNLKKNRILHSKSSENDHKDYPVYFIDGGLLDNKPFTYTIKEIYQRTTERPVFRKLFYIDPTPDRFLDNPQYQERKKPNVVDVLKDSLLGISRYESINNDLELIKEHNEKVRRYKFLLSDIEKILDKEIDQNIKDETNKDLYDQQRNVYLRTRLLSIKDKILPLIFVDSNDYLYDDKNRTEERLTTLKKVANALAKPLTETQHISERLAILKKFEKDVKSIDIEYTLRKYFFISKYIYKLLDRDYLKKWLNNKLQDRIQIENLETFLDRLTEKLTRLAQHLNKSIKTLKVIKLKLDDFFSTQKIEQHFYDLLDKYVDEYKDELSLKFIKCFYKDTLNFHKHFLNIDIEDTANLSVFAKQLDSIVKKKSIFEILSEPSSQELILEKLSKITEKEITEKNISDLPEISCYLHLPATLKFNYKHSTDIEQIIEDYLFLRIKSYFINFEKFDTFLYSLDYLAGIPEKQLIETERISTNDAQLGFSKELKNKNNKQSLLELKLAGDSYSCFK